MPFAQVTIAVECPLHTCTKTKGMECESMPFAVHVWKRNWTCHQSEANGLTTAAEVVPHSSASSSAHLP